MGVECHSFPCNASSEAIHADSTELGIDDIHREEHVEHWRREPLERLQDQVEVLDCGECMEDTEVPQQEKGHSDPVDCRGGVPLRVNKVEDGTDPTTNLDDNLEDVLHFLLEHPDWTIS